MTLTFIETEKKELTPRITVFGVGGAGGNAVNNMIDQQLAGVEFVVANTDAQALQQSRAPARIQLGIKVTEGLGAGARPQVGANAAEEALEEVIDHLAGAHMCFITAGMGGGTGTGAAPIIAQAARELGVLTVGVVTKPFAFEGVKRMRQAEEGVEALQKVVDTLIIIPNQNLFRLANEKTTFTEAFALADDVLYQGVKGVTDLMVRPGMINLDFADVRAVMDEMGKAMMGTGEAEGEDRARQAAEKAIANPLLDEISLHGARGVLINITGGNDLTLFELDEAANIIRKMVDEEANIIVGSTLDTEMNGKIRVSVVATGIEAQADAATLDVPRRRLAEPLTPSSMVQPSPEPEQYGASPQQHEPAASFAAEAGPPADEPVFEPAPEHVAYEPSQQPAPAAQHHGQYSAPHAAPAPEFRRAAPPAHPVQDEFDLDAVLNDGQQPPQHSARPADEWRDEAAAFVAPRPPQHQPGMPSPETLARLRAAVSKQPESGRPTPPRGADYYEPASRSQPMQHQPTQQQPQQSQQERSRFGIGSLISRMTGTGAGAEQSGSAQRVQPPVQGYDDEPGHERSAQERIEIPAFLRRQAN
ncbi:MAG: cell division protein FtsZ [Pararhodobacter sp.]|nr:cell division protein FtsZ [Pararhodobacter sp.]